MGRLRATKPKQNPHATELKQVRDKLRRIPEEIQSCQGDFAEARDQHVHDFKREVETALPYSTLQAISRYLPAAFASARQVTRCVN
jgi:hypothetical protein